MKDLEILMQLLGAISNDQPKKKSESCTKESLENPKLEADGYKTIIPPEVFAKLVEVRKLLTEAGDALVDNVKKTGGITSSSPYARVEAAIAIDCIGNSVKSVNTVLDIHNVDLVNTLNSQAVKHHVPVELISFLMMNSIIEDK